MTQPIWTPSEELVTSCGLSQFMRRVEGDIQTYQQLLDWSLKFPDKFWDQVWTFSKVIGNKGKSIFQPAGHIKEARFFPGATLNFSENLLRRRDAALAIVFQGEDKISRTLSFAELYDQVSQLRQSLIDFGLQPGDRVAAYLPNLPETIVAMLAATSLGAVWASASPDFGVQGVVDRFGQIEPKVLFVVDGYYYNGRWIECAGKVADIQAQLPSVTHTISISYGGDESAYSEVLRRYQPEDIVFEPFPFDHPLYIMFSSGTTGVPKCIVHRAGGVLVQHLKEHQLHCDIRKDDKVFYFTTTGWMMWNWLVSALASEATILLYDGAPFHPSGNVLWDFADAHGCTLFGTSAKYLDAMKKAGLRPKDTHDLSSLRTICSTGSPLVHEGFDYVYEAIKQDVHLASISGGTDIVSCFVLGNPISPVYRGEIQGPGLGMDVDVFDEQGQSVTSGAGDLVCKSPFPSMPLSFWNDPDGKKYHEAYFAKHDGVWCHGDWCEWTKHGGLIIHGRSDATLNPGGVRIGTAEIYRQVEKLPEIKESLAVGQDWDGDVRVILFVVMQTGALTESLIADIKRVIRDGASPRHVPAKIIEVSDLPRTKSGKITELAVRDVIHGRAVKNTEALANPEVLEEYRGIEELDF